MSVPTFQEELSRKSIEAIETLVRNVESGRITEEQCAAGIATLWAVSSGLVSSDFMILIELADKRFNKPPRTRKYFKKENTIVKVTNFHDGIVGLEFVGAEHTKLFDFREEMNPFKSAKEKFDSIEDSLVAKGFEEI